MAEKRIKLPKLPQSRGGNQSGKTPPRPRLTRRPLFWIFVAIIGVTIFGVIGKLGSASEEATSADWTRLAIVLGVSVVFLLLGSVRKLAGFILS